MPTKGSFDLLFDGIVQRLRDASESESSDDQYTVQPDQYREEPRQEGAYVFVYLGPITPKRQASGGPYNLHEAEYHVDVVTRLAGTKVEGESRIAASEVAGERCRLLIQQVIDAMRFGQPETYGLPKNAISERHLQRIDPATPFGQQSQNVIVAYRMTFLFTIGYNAERQESADLTQIRATDEDRWSAWFDYGGN